VSLQLYLQCSQCDATLLAPVRKAREAIRWAEETHRWIAAGQDQATFICPRHAVPCARCGHHNTTDEEITVRRRLRDKAAQASAERKEWMARYRGFRDTPSSLP
jgi:hypothetical protein